MKFDLVHTFECSLATLEGALLAPELPKRLAQAMHGIRSIEPLSSDDDGRLVRRRIKFVPTTEVPSFARGKIKPEMLEWVEESTYDRERHRFEYRILPNIPERWRDRFTSHGSYALREVAPGRTERRVEGEVIIKVMLIGGMAEKYVIGQVKKNFDDEAEGLRAVVRESAGR
jgi:Protein of unknown function (DUF2505)